MIARGHISTLGAILIRRLQGGESENRLLLRMNSTDRLCEMQMRGRGGVQNLENFADVF